LSGYRQITLFTYAKFWVHLLQSFPFQEHTRRRHAGSWDADRQKPVPTTTIFPMTALPEEILSYGQATVYTV